MSRACGWKIRTGPAVRITEKGEVAGAGRIAPARGVGARAPCRGVPAASRQRPLASSCHLGGNEILTRSSGAGAFAGGKTRPLLDAGASPWFASLRAPHAAQPRRHRCRLMTRAALRSIPDRRMPMLSPRLTLELRFSLSTAAGVEGDQGLWLGPWSSQHGATLRPARRWSGFALPV